MCAVNKALGHTLHYIEGKKYFHSDSSVNKRGKDLMEKSASEIWKHVVEDHG